MNITDILTQRKANAEKISNLEAEKLALETEFKTQAELVESLKAENATHSESLATALAEVKDRDSKIEDLQKHISEFNKALAEAEQKEKSAAVEAVKIVASVGVSAVPVTKTGNDESKTSSNEDVINEYNSITDPATRSAFFAKNRDRILNK